MIDQFATLIKRVQESMQREVTADEAIDSLKKCGVLDNNGNIRDAYKEIIRRSNQ